MKLAATVGSSLRLDGGFLIGRVLAFIAVVFIAQANVPYPLVALAFAVGCLGVVAVASKLRWLLPYAFLGAAALWGGVAATLLVDAGDGIGVMLALILALMDGSAFVSLGCSERA